MCQGDGEVTAAHPFCVFLQIDRLYFKGTDRAVFLDKREFTGPIYTQIKEAVDFVLRNIRLGATIDGLVRKEKYELPPEAIREILFLVSNRLSVVEKGLKSNTWILYGEKFERALYRYLFGEYYVIITQERGTIDEW